MIVSAKEILLKAKKEHYAVPHFNINNLEWTKYILEECQSNNSPVILGVSEGASRYMGGYEVISSLVINLYKSLNLTIPVSIHLDHGSSFEECKKAIDSGFTSVMIDASKLSLDDNIKVTNEVVNYAKIKGISVEAEIGHIGGEEDGNIQKIAYAKVDDCLKFCKDTNIDFFAPALGSVHGIYKGEPNLDFERMKEISNKLEQPLVLHGGTGINDILIKKAIESGICKININTELQIVWSKEVRKFINESMAYDPRKIISSGENAMKQTIKNKIMLFGSYNKA